MPRSYIGSMIAIMTTETRASSTVATPRISRKVALANRDPADNPRPIALAMEYWRGMLCYDPAQIGTLLHQFCCRRAADRFALPTAAQVDAWIARQIERVCYQLVAGRGRRAPLELQASLRKVHGAGNAQGRTALKAVRIRRAAAVAGIRLCRQPILHDRDARQAGIVRILRDGIAWVGRLHVARREQRHRCLSALEAEGSHVRPGTAAQDD